MAGAGEITAEAVKALRERTDLPMMECKKALIEAQGDMEGAIKILKEKVKGFKEKSKDRVTSEGRVATLTAADGSSAVIIEVQCESAPVARSDDFLFLCDQLCKEYLGTASISTVDELLQRPCPDRPSMTISELHEECLNKIREKIVVARLARLSGPVSSYTHFDGTLGVLLQVTGTNATAPIIRDVAMHIAALNPKYCLSSEVDPALVAKEREKQLEEARKSGKPENVLEKMIAGRMRVFFAGEGVLTEQPFAKDESKTVEKALADAGLQAKQFIRWRLGQA